MEIEKNELKKALEIVKPGLANKEIVEQTTSFAFIDGKVVTYNDEISISHPVKGLEVGGAIKAEELYSFLSKVKKDTIDVVIEDERVLLKSGRAKAGFLLEAEVSLPLDEEIAKKGKWKLLPKNFLEALSFAAQSCSKNMSDPKLTCAHINENGSIEATDNYRIVKYKVDGEMPLSSTLIPATSAVEVVKLNPNKVSKGDGWIHFKNKDQTIISCRVFNETFVDIDSIISVKGEKIKIKLPGNLENVLDTAHIFAKRKSVLDESVEIKITNKKIIVSSESETAEFSESIPLKYKGATISFKITPYLLKDIIQKTLICYIMKDRLVFKQKDWTYVTSLRG